MTRWFRDPRETSTFAPIDVGAVEAHKEWFVALGIGLILLGIVAVFLPLVASLVTTLAIGWVMVGAGLIEGFHALRSTEWRGSGWELLSAVVQVVAGGLVVAFPLVGKLALTLILAGYFVGEGILKLIRAAQHRQVRAPGWLVLDGLVSLVLGFLILVHWPAVAVRVFGLFVGVNLLLGGVSVLFIALGSRPAAPA
jgi:uncharacterized membrane protein HdeD (DUF308 family)